MKKGNILLLVVIVIFFLGTNHLYTHYQERRGEEYVPHKFKSTLIKSPTITPYGLAYVDGFLWISSSADQALLKYDLKALELVDSFVVPCSEAAGLTYDGENFWIADYSSRTIYQISPEGKVLGSYRTPLSTPFGVAWDGTQLWVLDVYGMQEYPDITGGADTHPNSKLYTFDMENRTLSDMIDSPAVHGRYSFQRR
jgi:hypothetical protein